MRGVNGRSILRDMKRLAFVVAIVGTSCAAGGASVGDGAEDGDAFVGAVGADGGAVIPSTLYAPPSREECFARARAHVVDAYLRAVYAAPREQEAPVRAAVAGAQSVLDVCLTTADYFERNPVFPGR